MPTRSRRVRHSSTISSTVVEVLEDRTLLAGAVVAEADYLLEADRLRAELGIDGSGIRIGVISDSYNALGGAPAGAQSGELPVSLGFLYDASPNAENPTDEGRAIVEIIHDIAPGAIIGFHSAYGANGEVFSDQSISDAIRNLADPAIFGADIIIDDVGAKDIPFFQDGQAAQAVDDVVQNLGVAYFSSAGNAGTASFEQINPNFDGDLLDFDPGPGIDTRLRIRLEPGTTFQMFLQWDDPFGNLAGMSTDLDVFVYGSLLGEEKVRSDAVNLVTGIPAEAIYLEYNNDSPLAIAREFDLEIRRKPGTTIPGRIKFIDTKNSGAVQEHLTNTPTVVGHAAATHAFAVGAVPYYELGAVNDYSSRGDTTILFDTQGNRLATPITRQTPTAAGIDVLATSFFNTLVDYDGNGIQEYRFGGTSAAAPTVAAVAALIKEEFPNASPQFLYDRLTQSARDLSPIGIDDASGAGLVNAWDAVMETRLGGQRYTPATLQPATTGNGVVYSEDFEAGHLSTEWTTQFLSGGRVRVVDDTPLNGTSHLLLDASTENAPATSQSEATLHLDLSGYSNVTLNVGYREFDDDDDPMSATFTNREGSDGIAFSVDGTTWHRLVSLTGSNISNTYRVRQFDLSAAASAAGVTLGNDVRIRFQQLGNSNATGAIKDGIAIDDITVLADVQNQAPTVHIQTALNYIHHEYSGYSLNDGWTRPFRWAVIDDPDDVSGSYIDEQISQIAVQITGGFQVGHDELTMGSSQYDSATGTLTFESGSEYATVSEFAGWLNTLRFRTTGTAGVRTFTVTVTDKNPDGPVEERLSGTATFQVNVKDYSESEGVIRNVGSHALISGGSQRLFREVNLSPSTNGYINPGGWLESEYYTQVSRTVIEITDGYVQGVDSLGYDPGAGHQDISTTGFDPATASLTFVGRPDFNSINPHRNLLQSVGFVNSESPTGTGFRTVRVSIYNGNALLGSEEVHLDVYHQPTGPEIDLGENHEVILREGAEAVPLFDTVDLSDLDSDQIYAVAVETQLFSEYDGDRDLRFFFEQPLPEGIQLTTDFGEYGELGVDPTMTIFGLGTLEEYETILKSMRIFSDDLGELREDREYGVQVFVYDEGFAEGTLNGADSPDEPAVASFVIKTLPANDGPRLEINSYSLLSSFRPYEVQNGVRRVYWDFTDANDPDDEEFSKLTVRILGGYDSAHDTLSIPGNIADGLTVSAFDRSTGTLTITGAESWEDYESTLRNLFFESTTTEPTSSRTLKFTLYDSNSQNAENGIQFDSAFVTFNVQGPPINAAPVIDVLPNEEFEFILGDDPQTIFESVNITDTDDTELFGAEVEIVGYGPENARDFIHAGEFGTGVTGYWDYNGTFILSGRASIAEYVRTLESLTFFTGGASENGSRTFRVTITDANSENAANGRQTASDTRRGTVSVPQRVIGFDPDSNRFWTDTVREGELTGDGPGFWDPTRDYNLTLYADLFESRFYNREAGTGTWYVSQLTFGEQSQFAPETEWGQWEGWKANPNVWRSVTTAALNGPWYDSFPDDVLGITTSGGIWGMTVNETEDGFDEEFYIGQVSGAKHAFTGSLSPGFGDGNDIAVFYESGGNSGWAIFESGDNGYLAPTFAPAWNGTGWTNLDVTDLNGDGYGDLIGQQNGRWVISLFDELTGDFRAPFQVANWTNPSDYADVTYRDVNFDHVPDLLARHTPSGRWEVRYGRQNNGNYWLTTSPATWATWDGWRLSRPWVNTTYGDFNNDGNLDLVTQADHGASWWMMLANENGDGFQDAVSIDLFNLNDRWSNVVGTYIQNVEFQEGDGRLDMIAFNEDAGTWWVATSSFYDPSPYALDTAPAHAGFDHNGDFQNIAQGDFDGDGYSDVLAHDANTGALWVLLGAETASGYLRPQRWEGLDAGWQLARTWDQLTIGDVNGDDRDDVLIRNDRNAVFMLLTNQNGDGFLTETYIDNVNPNVTRQFLIDVNGDGRDDLVNYDAQTKRWYYAAARATGTGFWRMWPSEQWRDLDWVDIQTADIDGDGREDITARVDGGNGMYVMLANVAGTGFERPRWVGNFPWREDVRSVQIGDVNGDDLLDLVAWSRTDGRWHVMLGTGNRTALYAAPVAWGSWTGWKQTATWDDFLVADFNHDGRDDILARTASGGWWLMLANNTGDGFLSETYAGGWPGNINWNFTGLR